MEYYKISETCLNELLTCFYEQELEGYNQPLVEEYNTAEDYVEYRVSVEMSNCELL
jgi:hypothetical protein